ncbi:MAG: hypothetical protein ACI97A_003066 [Planctomycetota bacterium]|jgi:hypothetical protein
MNINRALAAVAQGKILDRRARPFFTPLLSQLHYELIPVPVVKMLRLM